MTCLRQWFTSFTETTGETPETIVFGKPEYIEWPPLPDGITPIVFGKPKYIEWPPLPDGITPWADLPPAILDREFDAGFGRNESPDLCAWSPTWVIFSDNYDGAEGLCWVPRNPLVHHPVRPGGG